MLLGVEQRLTAEVRATLAAGTPVADQYVLDSLRASSRNEVAYAGELVELRAKAGLLLQALDRWRDVLPDDIAEAAAEVGRVVGR